MSLDNLKLPAEVVTHLFNEYLVDINGSNKEPHLQNENRFNILGKNEKNILLIVNDSSALHLNDADFQFMTGVLNACKLSMADIGLLNVFHYEKTGMDEIIQSFSPNHIILFDVKDENLKLKNPVVDFEILNYKNIQILPAPSLRFISENTDEKKKLWSSLKKLFNL